jgi:hypothetical protein
MDAMLFPRKRHCLELFQGNRRAHGGPCRIDAHAPLEGPLIEKRPPPSDLRELPPPEPLLRILETLDAGGPGPHVFLLVREPVFLYPLISGDGWRHATALDERGYVLTVYRENP